MPAPSYPHDGDHHCHNLLGDRKQFPSQKIIIINTFQMYGMAYTDTIWTDR